MQIGEEIYPVSEGLDGRADPGLGCLSRPIGFTGRLDKPHDTWAGLLW